MRVLHLSETDAGSGAGRAAYRLHQALLQQGVESAMLVGSKRSTAPSVSVAGDGKLGKVKSIFWPYLDSLPPRFYPKRSSAMFSAAWFGYCRAAQHRLVQQADVVSLYWVNGGFLRPKDIGEIRKPVVWRLSDMWPFTGGCHYSGDCDHYKNRCGKCSALGSMRDPDLSSLQWRQKNRNWRKLNLTIAAPSLWIAEKARESALFRGMRVEVIPTGVDLNRFRPFDQHFARDAFGLPRDGKLVLFGALGTTSDPRKGFGLLKEALGKLVTSSSVKGVRVAVFGGGPDGELAHFDIPVHNVGRLYDDVSLALLYSAADVLVCPSREDNLPNIAIEALACGIPVVGMLAGGMPELIDHQLNGYLASATDASDLANGIQWVLADEERRVALGHAARTKAEKNFALDSQAARYVDLYKELVAANGRPENG